MTRLRSLRHAVSAHHLEHEARHVALFLLLGGALALAAAVGVAWAAGFGHVAHRLRHPHVVWLLLALVGAAATHVGYVLAYREVAHVDEGVRIHPLRAGALVATGFGIFVPRGGFALDLEALRDLGVPPREARVRVLGLGSLEYAVLATGACVSALVLLARHAHAQQAVLLSWAIGVPAGTALALLAARWREAICRGPLAGPLRPALEGIDVVGKILRLPREHGAAAFLGMSIYWAGEVFVLWACLSAFTNGAPSIPAVVVGYATGYALTRRTLPLAGAGAVEALLPFALGWVGFPLAAAVLAVVAYRVVNVWLPVGPALAGMIALRRRRASAGRRSPSSRS
ncbi:MAG TPA: lysylphosphatidylglycerol synthase domain-containing protein [Gaiellaceae bacterium]|nr:lysylphosphatidylglycerol synthase domain-containing protein [Gaiellaceae bacterium]